ncbi:class I tRNA ligase family protein [Paraburkholderia sp. GAS206C]|uniref:class I tRNA ligase family protein n=1 Tax=unclassified Paraburkholderia TaxID=2615204 RepID=UPI003D206420
MQPTPNGRLHIGHIAGPYLQADILSRALKREGHAVTLACGSDAWENWVVLAATQAKMDPTTFAREKSAQIRDDLSKINILPSIWVDPVSDEHRDSYGLSHEQFLQRMIGIGACQRIPEQMARSIATGKYVIGTWITGKCPECKCDVAGNSCVRCGAGFQPNEIIDPKSRIDESGLEWVSTPAYFVEASNPHEILRALKEAGVAERYLRIVQRHLQRSKFVRLSQPGDWGIKSELIGAENVLTNTYFGFCRYLIDLVSRNFEAKEGAETPESNIEIVALFGMDNAGVGLVAPAVLSLASSSKLLFDTIVVNSLLHFEGSKCSTSRKHGIWIAEVFGEDIITADELRFCLSQISLDLETFDITIDFIVERVNLLRNWIRARVIPSLMDLPDEFKISMTKKLTAAFAAQRAFLRPKNFNRELACQIFIDWMHQESSSNACWLYGVAILGCPFLPHLTASIWESLGLAGEIRVTEFSGLVCSKRNVTVQNFEWDLTADKLTSICHISKSEI